MGKFIRLLFVFLLVVALLAALYFLVSRNVPKIYCIDDERNVDICIEIYEPVCGYLQVDCITEPCDLQPRTFSNGCFACSNERVQYYTEGECK